MAEHGLQPAQGSRGAALEGEAAMPEQAMHAGQPARACLPHVNIYYGVSEIIPSCDHTHSKPACPTLPE